MAESLYYKLGKGLNCLARKWAASLSEKERKWSQRKKKTVLFSFIASMLFLLWGSVILNWSRKKFSVSGIDSVRPPTSISPNKQYSKTEHLKYLIDSLKRNHRMHSGEGSRLKKVN